MIRFEILYSNWYISYLFKSVPNYKHYRHIKGQVVVALACGMIAVFKRNAGGEWDLSNYYLVQIGLPHQPIRCLQAVDDTVWCGYRNKIHVLQPNGLKIIHSIEAHPRTESLVSN